MKKWRKTMGKKYYSSLVSAVLIGLMSITPYAEAEDTDYLATRDIEYNGRYIAEINFLKSGQGIGNSSYWIIDPSLYNMSDELIEGTVQSSRYWTDMLQKGAKNTDPWQIFVHTNYAQNASAVSPNIKSDGVYNSYYNAESFVRHQLQYDEKLEELTIEDAETGVLPAGNYGFSEITVGYAFGAFRKGAIDGWWVDAETVLPTNEQAADYVGTFRHELGHALGITEVKRIINGKTYFHPGLTDKTSWSLQLMDQNGNKGKAGMRILTSEEFAKIQAANPDIPANRYFIVDKEVTADGKGYAYFSGPNVVDALGGAKFFGRSALPVNGWESKGFDGGHIQTAGMMSHRDYTNYTSFLEVELAAIQDLGYKLDRKAYFGRSIYGNGGIINNTQGYFARNNTGTAYLENTYSEVPLGIGLHIYGYGNKVTQSADILTRGTGGTGIRVDGMTNTLIIPKDTEIHADGERGNGVLIAYGRNQTVEQAGTVTAKGDGGVGIRFDFGSSSNGAADEYRGSYIRYERSVNGYDSGKDAGTISSAKNINLTSIGIRNYSASNDELDGPLVDNYNLSGRLAGDDAAIYIGKNAFVKNININSGASIHGDIISDWKQFDVDECEGVYDSDGDERDVLRIQYNGKTGKNGYDYFNYIPDLVTNLNFNNDNMTYNGNITGEDNMKMNVAGGILNYSGEANVVNVTVAKGAELYGGSYQVNDMSKRMATGYTDDTTGKFINHGTIGAENGDTTMNIDGYLDSDGYLQAYDGGTKGQILVDGDANIEGSTVLAEASLPGEENVVLETTGSISGSITNDKYNPYAFSAMLNTTGAVEGNKLIVYAYANNNLVGADPQQMEAYYAMSNMFDHLYHNGDKRTEEMRTLYSMDNKEAKEALTAISSSPVPNTMNLIQRNTMNSHIISSRLNEAFAKKDVEVPVPSAGLDSNDTSKNPTMKMKLDQPVDNDFWFKTARNWGEGTGSSYYQGTTIAGGWDRAYGKNWRAGIFVSHGSFSFADNLSHDDVKDTRLGVYGGYSNGPHNAHVYLDYGWQNNDLTRRLTGLGLQAQADYNSRILELGGEYKYDLNAKNMKVWHISPYANVQLSQLWQDGYTEKGAGIFGHRVDGQSNTYFAGGLGLEFKRYLSNGSYGMRLGVKHAFAGSDPKLTYGYVGDTANSYELRGQNDKTHFVMSLGGEAEFAPGWTLAGDLALQKGSHDKDIMAAITLRRMW
ncbi:putative autotransporter protein [Anaerovibrio sp. JC8]|uniref:autotransporter outer membrane beta-barrel domain-containing protein n=1 Tax=Anaerovibrio sp. JC8 TaxID=1240085 RepID=UPI000A0A9B2F|nr:autotransporter outer membrane beta-barrel domain-containing protein [Anaerovibrio sp. JC8]ORT98932.1 putative autotransporter protein [Anaerovibrio sp. JC8]